MKEGHILTMLCSTRGLRAALDQERKAEKCQAVGLLSLHAWRYFAGGKTLAGLAGQSTPRHASVTSCQS